MNAELLRQPRFTGPLLLAVLLLALAGYSGFQLVRGAHTQLMGKEVEVMVDRSERTGGRFSFFRVEFVLNVGAERKVMHLPYGMKFGSAKLMANPNETFFTPRDPVLFVLPAAGLVLFFGLFLLCVSFVIEAVPGADAKYPGAYGNIQPIRGAGGALCFLGALALAAHFVILRALH